MTEREFSTVVETLARDQRVPMEDVSKVLRGYFQLIETRCSLESIPPKNWGIIGLDRALQLNRGITIISGFESCGKTSAAKQIAISARLQGLTVAYYDADNKLFLHDLEAMMNIGIIFANSYRESGLTELINSGLIDVLIIDSLTALHLSSHHSFISKVRKFVPFVILTTQTRSEWGTNKAIAACDERILSMSNCEIMLSNKEHITVESEDIIRVQFKVLKNEADRTKERQHGSFIIKNNLVDTTYCAFDILRTRGRVRSFGEMKYLDKIDIGKIKTLDREENEEKRVTLIRTSLEEIGLEWDKYEQVYGRSTRSLCRDRTNVPPVQNETQREDETSPTDPGEF